jgi:hypothetical protein
MTYERYLEYVREIEAKTDEELIVGIKFCLDNIEIASCYEFANSHRWLLKMIKREFNKRNMLLKFYAYENEFKTVAK